jgi:hypothetical protein
MFQRVSHTVDKENELMREQLVALKRRGTPDSDPRVKAIKRILSKQNVGMPKEGIDFPSQIKFKSRRKQHGAS